MSNCAWVQDEDFGAWETNCGHCYAIIEGTPAANGMKFCCYCGKPLEGMPWIEEETE